MYHGYEVCRKWINQRLCMKIVLVNFVECINNVYKTCGLMLGASKSILEETMRVIMKNSLRNAHQHPLYDLSAMKNY